MEHSLPTVWTAIGQRGAFKAVMAGIAVIEIQVCSPLIGVYFKFREIVTVNEFVYGLSLRRGQLDCTNPQEYWGQERIGVVMKSIHHL